MWHLVLISTIFSNISSEVLLLSVLGHPRQPPHRLASQSGSKFLEERSDRRVLQKQTQWLYLLKSGCYAADP